MISVNRTSEFFLFYYKRLSVHENKIGSFVVLLDYFKKLIYICLIWQIC